MKHIIAALCLIGCTGGTFMVVEVTLTFLGVTVFEVYQ